MTLYTKIQGPFKRHTEGPLKNQLIIGDWTRPEFDLLATTPWHFTEKIDGTNIRIIWDGYKVEVRGRTDAANFKQSHLDFLYSLFPEELLEQKFGVTSAVIYGELFGPGIQKGGGDYGPLQFNAFDVKVGNWWLLPEDVADVSTALGVSTAPVFGEKTLLGAIYAVTAGLKSQYGDFWAEGVVGRPALGLTARDGNRLLVKVKHVDLYKA